MKLLLDTCVWGGVRAELQAAGHDVLWTGDLPADPGDEAILAQTYREQRVLVTLDKDFGELAIVRRLPHAGIVRLVNIPSRQQAAVCQHVLTQHGTDLALGAIVTAETGRLRIRPPRHSYPQSASSCFITLCRSQPHKSTSHAFKHRAVDTASGNGQSPSRERALVDWHPFPNAFLRTVKNAPSTIACPG